MAAIHFADVVYGADIGLIESGGRTSLAPKALDGVGIGGAFFGKKFESNTATEACVLGLVNDAHAAATEFMRDAVMAELPAGK
jgi:hypothetical protein